ncbi:hypothetical protein AS96_09160 [Microbacterium sp. MRS-1]|nr:hypothetical protein AS96_09160 [Microbacterium sp. MRS-1]
MRIGGGIVLGIVATVVGASAAFWFALSGLIWSGGFAHGYGWEEGESELGVALGVAGLFGWLVLLALAMVTLLAGATRRPRSSRVTATLVVVLSAAVVATLCVLALLTPQPASEYPLPPWNRA